MIADRDRGHPRANLAHHPGALMPQDRRKQPLAVQPVQRVGIGMANPRRHDLDQHLAGARPLQVDLDNLQRALGFECNGGTALHRASPRRPPLAMPAQASQPPQIASSPGEGRSPSATGTQLPKRSSMLGIQSTGNFAVEPIAVSPAASTLASVPRDSSTTASMARLVPAASVLGERRKCCSHSLHCRLSALGTPAAFG